MVSIPETWVDYFIECAAYIEHLLKRHDEDTESLEGLVNELREIHPDMNTLEILDLIHTIQHDSEDWDAGHDKDDI